MKKKNDISVGLVQIKLSTENNDRKKGFNAWNPNNSDLIFLHGVCNLNLIIDKEFFCWVFIYERVKNNTKLIKIFILIYFHGAKESDWKKYLYFIHEDNKNLMLELHELFCSTWFLDKHEILEKPLILLKTFTGFFLSSLI